MSENAQAGFDVEELRELVAGALELPVGELTDEARFQEDLELDSLISLEVAVRLEERYGIKVDEDELGEIGSFRDVAELVRARVVSQSAA